MSRIRKLEVSEVGPATRVIYDQFLKQRGNVPNIMKTPAHNPALLETGVSHINAVMAAGEVPVYLKELLAVRVSQINHCDY